MKGLKMRKNSKLLEQVLADCLQYFPPFRLMIETAATKSKYNIALWENMVCADFGIEWHRVSVNWGLIKDKTDLIESVCHELVHAFQYENGLETDHGKEFANWCAFFTLQHDINILSSDVLAEDFYLACEAFVKV